MKRYVPWLLCLVVVVANAGCSALPTSGEVGSAPREDSAQALGGIAVIPDPPSQGASPSQIVQGFLNAMVNSENDYATAKAYLTQEAAAAWTPQAEVLIYASGITPRVNDDQVTITGALVGRLGSDSAYASVDNPSWTHDFHLVREDNQWRISHPTTGLALSQYMFSQTYMRVEAYFFDEAYTVLVPDSRYVPISSWNPAKAVDLVMSGPSTWLTPVIDNSYRSSIMSAGQAFISPVGSILTVPLSSDAKDLSVEEATRLAIEVAATIRDMISVSWVRLTVDDQGLALDSAMGAATHDTLPKIAADLYNRTASMGAANLYFVSGGYIYRTDGTSRSRLPSTWGTLAHDISSFAVDHNSSMIAAATPEGLLVGGIVDGEVALKLSGEGLLRPQFAWDKSLWAMMSGPEGTQVWMGAEDAFYSIDTTHLAGLVIHGFQLAPDGHRILLLVRHIEEPEGPMRVGIALVETAGGRASAIVNFRQIQTSFHGASLTSLVDIAWMGPSSMVLLGSSQQGRAAEVFYTDRDALTTEEWGNPEQWTVNQMAAHAQEVSVLDGQSQVWTYQEGQHWTKVAEDVTAIGYPG